jgi:putative ABC transport system ATP-binding protein
MSIIEVQKLEKIYVDGDVKTPALNGVDLSINEGEFVAIIGASGSGKSTLLQILGGLDRSSAGEYIFNNHNINEYSDEQLAHIRNKEMGFVFQAFNLLPKLTVLENIKLPLIYANLSEDEREKRARDMVRLVALEDRVDFRTTKLSGGQKQRVAIARALVNDPKVIFADEPTGSLDSKSGEIIMAFLQELHGQGHTIILVTHESYVAESAERILHIKDGMIDRDERVVNRKLISSQGFYK